MNVRYEYLLSLRYREHIPRKIKKTILGFRVKRYKLKKLLKSVRVIESARTCYETPAIEPYMFCPKCSCTAFIGTGNMAAYPEHWEDFYCLRCGNKVASIDNSPFIHALEFPEDNYELK